MRFRRGSCKALRKVYYKARGARHFPTGSREKKAQSSANFSKELKWRFRNSCRKTESHTISFPGSCSPWGMGNVVLWGMCYQWTGEATCWAPGCRWSSGRPALPRRETTSGSHTTAEAPLTTTTAVILPPSDTNAPLQLKGVGKHFKYTKNIPKVFILYLLKAWSFDFHFFCMKEMATLAVTVSECSLFGAMFYLIASESTWNDLWGYRVDSVCHVALRKIMACLHLNLIIWAKCLNYFSWI